MVHFQNISHSFTLLSSTHSVIRPSDISESSLFQLCLKKTTIFSKVVSYSICTFLTPNSPSPFLSISPSNLIYFGDIPCVTPSAVMLIPLNTLSPFDLTTMGPWHISYWHLQILTCAYITKPAHIYMCRRFANTATYLNQAACRAKCTDTCILP